MKYFFILFVLIQLSCSSSQFEMSMSKDGIWLDGALHDVFIEKDSLILSSFRIVDLNNESSYRPYLRAWGLGQPKVEIGQFELEKYNEGWFVLNNDRMCLTYLANQRKAIYFETIKSAPIQANLIGKSVQEPEVYALPYLVLIGTDLSSQDLEALLSENDLN